MKQIGITSTKELRQIVAELGDQILFRGQVSHHEKNGRPSVITSFDRRGCIPSQMLKWSRYADNVLDLYINAADGSVEFTQALLQHYGWRSFYVDCSSSAAASAWFASHVYSDKRTIEMCEDYEERPIMLVKRMARYEYIEGDGHLYVFDKPLAQRLVGLFDLASIKIDSARARTEVQNAWLLGPLRNKEVPLECLIAHITGRREIFRNFAAEEGLSETDHLFPPAKGDPILDALLGLPWNKIKLSGDKLGISAFQRVLDLPEYQVSFAKIVSGATAFYHGNRVADLGSIDGCAAGGIVRQVPEVILYGTADEGPLRFPKVGELLAAHGCVVFEVDELVQHVNMRGLGLYQKGIVVTAHEPSLIELCELLVEHPGLDLKGAGMNKGWFYRIGDDGSWVREASSEQCDCGNDNVHLRHISSLRIVERFLATPGEFG